MKIRNILFTIASVAVLSLVSCEQVQIDAPGDYPFSDDGAGAEEMTFAVKCPAGMTISSYDCVSVFSMAEPDSNRMFSFVSFNGTEAVFKGNARKSDTYCVVYPFSASNSVSAVDNDGMQCSINATLPETQNEGYNSDVYVAMADSASLKFYPTCTTVRVPLVKPAADTTKAVAVSVSGLAGESLAGPMKIAMCKGAAPMSVRTTGTNATPRTFYTDLTICSDTSYVSMSVPPQTFSQGYKIEVILDDWSSRAATEIHEAASILVSGNTTLKSFVYEPKFYVDFESTVHPDFGSYKLEFDDETMTGRVWFFTSSVPARLFYGRVNVTKVTIPSFITALGESSFQGMTGLTEFVFEPGSRCTEFGLNALQGNTALQSIVIPNSVVTLGVSCMQGLRGLTSITFEQPCNVETFSQNCLYNCISLPSIVIPASVKTMGNSCLKVADGTKLTSFTIEEGSQLELMDGQSLEGHNLIGTISFPPSIKTITNPNGSTKNCSPKLTIIVPLETPPTFTGKFGNGTAQILAIKVPKGSIPAYEAATEPGGASGTGWSRYVGKYVEIEE